MNLKKILGGTDDSDILLEELGVKGLSEEEKVEVVQKLMDHFQKVVLDTVILSLNDEQVKEFRKIIEEKPSDLENKITLLTAQVPGLGFKIEEAVKNEMLILKQAKKQLD